MWKVEKHIFRSGRNMLKPPTSYLRYEFIHVASALDFRNEQVPSRKAAARPKAESKAAASVAQAWDTAGFFAKADGGEMHWKHMETQ